ncbi:S-layer homology domain-containing protein [Paenibacillus taichungensis]|uniref:S-layer homology domain-containing protein n=1 Tax=Paenibacillus taichungensis TaxID=484184 RepID=UPI002877736F|nr:S-layer homology domain-containing protein [Paenibacillus taichungensis]
MIKTPDVLLLDEPFSGLDKESTGHLLSSLKRIKSQGTSIIAAVHDTLLAGQLESRTYWIRQGRILMDDADDSSAHSTAFFEMEGSVDQETLGRLSSLFSDATWKTYDNGDNQIITRQEALVIMNRALRLAGLETDGADAVSLLSPFAAQAAVAAWAKQAMAAAVKNRLVEGSTEGLMPTKNLTRGETAAIVQRFLVESNLIDNQNN